MPDQSRLLDRTHVPDRSHGPGAIPPRRRGRQRAREARARRRALIAGGAALAGIALAAGSTALASASWTDRTWFQSSATTGTADLEGSIDAGAHWAQSNDGGAIELVLPSLTDLRPGDTTAYPIQVRNTGSLPVALVGSVTTSGQLFTGASPATAVLSGLPGSVAGAATVSATLTVTAPAWTGFEHQGETGSAKVSIVGTVE